MKRMNCVLNNSDGTVCGKLIDYDGNTKTAKNLDGTDHIHAKKKQWVKNEHKSIDSELHLLGKISNVEAKVSNLEERIGKLEAGLKDAWETIAKLSYKKGNEIK